MQTRKLYSKNKMKLRLNKFLLYLIIFAILMPSINFSLASPRELPDLKIKNVPLPDEAMEGDNILINVTVENIGGDISEGIEIEVGLFIDSDDAAVSINSTYEGFSSDTIRYFHLFWIAEIDTHSLRIFVDFNNKINESIEHNNQIIKFIYVEEGPPLILINKIVVPSNMKVNETAKIQVGVKNVGSFTSQNILAQLKIIEDDFSIAKEKENGLDRGEMYNFSFDWVPKNFGDYTFNFTIKLENNIQDREEINKDVSPFKLEWWDGNWHYRKLIGVYGSGNISQFFNFTDLLNDLNIFSKTFENNTIRIIEYSKKGDIVNENINYKFSENEEFNKITNAIGNLSWNVLPANQNPVKKYFYIYFDTTENEGDREIIDDTDNFVSSYFDLIYEPVVEGWWDNIICPKDNGYSIIEKPLNIIVSTIAKASKVTANLRYYKDSMDFKVELTSSDGSFINWSGQFNIPNGKTGDWNISMDSIDGAGYKYNLSKNDFYVGKPDLAVKKISYKPSRVYEGDLVTISTDIHSYNVTLDEVNTTLKIKDSKGNIVNTQSNLTTITKDKVNYINFSWMTNKKGNYRVDVKVTSINVLDESNVNNNNKTVYIKVNGIPDLGVVDIITPLQSVEEGKSLAIKAIINNTGKGFAEDYMVRLYLSQGVMDWADNQIKDTENFSVGINKTVEVNLTWNQALYGAPGFNGGWIIGVLIFYNDSYRDLYILNNTETDRIKVVPGEKNPPVIEITELTEIVEIGRNVSFKVKAKDSSGIKTVNISITNPIKTKYAGSMIFEEDDVYSYVFDKTSKVGTYSFNITATDNSFYKVKKTKSGVFKVTEDETPPIIKYFGAHPSVQEVGGVVEISCISSDLNGIKSVNTVIVFPDNHTETRLLTHEQDGKYTYSKTFETLGKYIFRISSEDYTGNIGLTEDKEFWITTDLEDIDGDGIPNDWEKRYGFDPKNPNDAGYDKDGDGYTNLEEYKNGYDPLDIQSSVKEIITKLKENWMYLIISVIMFVFIIVISVFGIRRLRYENI